MKNNKSGNLTEIESNWIHDKYPWQIFAGFDFSKAVSGRVAFERFNGLCRELAQNRIHGHVAVSWFWGVQYWGAPYFHALFYALPHVRENMEALTIGDFDGLWPWGTSKIEIFDDGRAANYGERHKNFEINVACPRRPRCRRSKGCREAPGPWPSPASLLIK